MNEAHVWWDGMGPLWTRLEDLEAEDGFGNAK